ncbi:type I restriction-modification system subunit M [Gloeobacter kilaueensis]|uniref:Type I restriction-modification system methyltransferase subunit n=1 Tax=Gloeobacter kilaueensis (strain ATCC BAA-2537 / CCAP 1431/1 / ULC 316 / JS1) TaxID=1183438 RepID=U5QGA3_GLOK1|nr:type I restriction-modification system subunit M [Gloeobacter kilaueensis]AGY57997.1 type I restriction-modification system methyltransferase subunit [Gloeobacter kilaueensis JS1]
MTNWRLADEPGSLESLRREVEKERSNRKIRPDFVCAPLQPGWMRPLLFEMDTILWGRWEYWLQTQEAGHLLERLIPQIAFLDDSHNYARRMIERCLDAIGCGWSGWSSWSNFNTLLDWILFGLGHGNAHTPPPLDQRIQGQLYQTFELGALQLWPHDYWGALLAENRHGRHNGFYPTPLPVCELMAKMLFVESGDPATGRPTIWPDCRARLVYEPCVGTGRMLMVASNYSLRLSGCDIDPTVLKACLVNLWLYAPWGIAPFKFLEDDGPIDASAEAEQETTTVPEHACASDADEPTPILSGVSHEV